MKTSSSPQLSKTQVDPAIEFAYPWGGEWSGKQVFEYQGNKVEVETRPEWRTDPGNTPYGLQAFLINGNLGFFKNQGTLRPENVQREMEIFREMIEISGEKDLFLLYDASDLDHIGLLARRKILQLETAMIPYKRHYLFVLAPFEKIMFTIYGRIKPEIAAKSSFYGSWEEGFSQYLSFQTSRNPIQQVKLLQDEALPEIPADHSLAALEAENRQLKEELKRQKEDQLRHIDKLIDSLANITIHESFETKHIPEPDPEDPFHSLIAAFNLLQSDISEVVGDMIELNRNLEEKITVRAQNLMEKEIQLHSIIENTKDMVVSVDREMKVLYINSVYQDYLKDVYGLDVHTGDYLFKGNGNDRLDIWAPKYERAFNGESFREEISRVVKGQQFFAELFFNPILDKEGSVTGTVLFIRNQTEKRKAEKIIRENEQLLTSISRNLKDGIYRSTPGAGVVFANEAFLEMFGYDSLEDLRSVPTEALYEDPERRKELSRFLEKDGFYLNQVSRYRRKDGSLFWGMVTSNLARDGENNLYYDGAIRDISETIEKDKKLQDQNQELTKINRELDQFVYSTSHDLRSPLVSILGLLDLMKREKDPADRMRFVQMIELSARKMDQYIRDIISFSRNSRMKIHSHAIQFDKIFRTVQEAIRELPDSEKVEILFSLNQTHSFSSDPNRIETIFFSLLSNAIQYSDPGKEHRFVNISVEADEKIAVISVQDNGCGISAQNQDRIFDMFFRGSSSSKGSGLGLYILKETLAKLEGSVSVTSEPGIGTTFIVKIPNLAKPD
jgi:PAS domain S-box-containing protein